MTSGTAGRPCQVAPVCLKQLRASGAQHRPAILYRTHVSIAAAELEREQSGGGRTNVTVIEAGAAQSRSPAGSRFSLHWHDSSATCF